MCGQQKIAVSGSLPRRRFSVADQSEHFTAKPPLKKFVFVRYLFGGGEENRTPVRKPLRATFSGRSPAFFIPGGGGAGRRVPLGIPLIYDGFKGNGPFTFTAS